MVKNKVGYHGATAIEESRSRTTRTTARLTKEERESLHSRTARLEHHVDDAKHMWLHLKYLGL